MSFSLQSVVVGIIQQVYHVDFKINQLYRRKFALQKQSVSLGKERVRAIGSKDGKSTAPIMFMDSDGQYRAATNRVEGWKALGLPVGTPWAEWTQDQKDQAVKVTDTGTYQIGSVAEAEGHYKAIDQGTHAFEAEIDSELETLKAQRTALNAQREEFTKYVSEGIKQAFKNNYA